MHVSRYNLSYVQLQYMYASFTVLYKPPVYSYNDLSVPVVVSVDRFQYVLYIFLNCITSFMVMCQISLLHILFHVYSILNEQPCI